MSYTIKHPDGTTLLTLGDGKVDERNTSLTLIGKNIPTYGEYYNNNNIALLQNFASVDEPRSPLVGQMWYDIASGRMMVYDLNDTFRPITGVLSGETQPIELAQNEFWWDVYNQQIRFSPDGQDTYLVGPAYPTDFGNMGIMPETVNDIDNTGHNVGFLYNNDSLIGIISNSSFDLKTSVEGITSVTAGITLNSLNGDIRFAGTATSADSIQGIDITKLLRNNINEATTGSFSILTNLGLAIGNEQDLTMYVDNAIYRSVLQHNRPDGTFRINVTDTQIGVKTALHFEAADSYLGVWNTNPAYPLDIIGNTRIQGNLIVLGNTTNITSTNLQVNDKNIELGYDVGNDEEVDGGGITLHGSTDHTVMWMNDGTGWNFNDNVNLPSTTTNYQISGTTVLTNTSLGQGIHSAPGLTRLGVLDILTVTNVVISGSTVGVTGTNQTLYFNATGSGTIDVNSKTVSSLATPIVGTDAANKQYVDDRIQQKNNATTVLSMDVTNFAEPVENGIISYLNKLMPILNTQITMVCSDTIGETNQITCDGTSQITSGTVLTFLGTTFGNITTATTYYVKDVTDNTHFTVSTSTIGDVFVLTTASGTMNAVLSDIYQEGDDIYNISTGTRIRILCSSVSIDKPSALLNLNVATETVDKNSATSSVSVVTAVAGTSTQQTLVPTITYTIRQFRVDSTLIWTYDGEIV